MKKMTKRTLSVAIIGVLCAILALVLPAIFIPQTKTIVMGFVTTFSGNVNFNGNTVHVGFAFQLFIAWLLPLVATGLAIAFGNNQKSTFFFTMILFIASGILYALSMKYFLNINVAGSIAGFQTSELCAQPYVLITLNGIGAIASLFGIFYKPSTRYSKYR